MKRLAAALVTVAALGGAGVASAAPGEHHCRPATPGFTTMLTSWDRASCAQARAVERFWVGHETEGRPFRAAGVRWVQHTYPTASPRLQATMLTAPHREIDIVHRLAD
jgi:hypothetical protein